MGRRKDRLIVSGTGMVTAWGEGPVVGELLASCTQPPLAEVEPGVNVPFASLGRLKKHPFRARLERFGRLDGLSQYAVVAAGHSLDDAGFSFPSDGLDCFGAMLGTCYGTQESNWRFDQFSLDPEEEERGLRPLLFKSTVDNVPLGWVSIAYGLRGVTTTFISGPGAGAEALWAAAQAVNDGRAPGVVVCGAERPIFGQIAALYRDSKPTPFLGEGAAAIVVESGRSVEARGGTPRGELLAWGLVPWSQPGHLRRWLGAQGVKPEDVILTTSVAVTEKDGVTGKALFEGAGLGGRSVADHRQTGNHLSAQPLLALPLLMARLGEEPSRVALLAAKGEGDMAFIFVLSAPRG